MSGGSSVIRIILAELEQPSCRSGGAMINVLSHFHRTVNLASIDFVYEAASAAHISKIAFDDRGPFPLNYLVIALGHVIWDPSKKSTPWPALASCPNIDPSGQSFREMDARTTVPASDDLAWHRATCERIRQIPSGRC